MLLKQTCTSFAGNIFSLRFEKQKLFHMFLSELSESNLSLKSIFYQNKSLSSLNSLKTIYKTSTDFEITTQESDKFLRLFAEFHNQHNSEKNVSSSESLCKC